MIVTSADLLLTIDSARWIADARPAIDADERLPPPLGFLYFRRGAGRQAASRPPPLSTGCRAAGWRDYARADILFSARALLAYVRNAHGPPAH